MFSLATFSFQFLFLYFWFFFFEATHCERREERRSSDVNFLSSSPLFVEKHTCRACVDSRNGADTVASLTSYHPKSRVATGSSWT
jgi:hypothetical protein